MPEEKRKVKEKAKVEEKPKEQPVTIPAVKGKTLKGKIDEIVERVSESGHINKEELKKELFQLVQRVLYPDQFCPECDERLFFNPLSGFSCPNCGFQRVPSTAPQVVARPSQTGPVPKEAERMIQRAEEELKEPRRTTAPTSRGEQIRRLVDGGSTLPPTAAEKRRLRQDPNVGSEVNWV